jgi:hypothetical protein
MNGRCGCSRATRRRSPRASSALRLFERTRQSEGVFCDLWPVARENLAHTAKMLIHRADVIEENNL